VVGRPGRRIFEPSHFGRRVCDINAVWCRGDDASAGGEVTTAEDLALQCEKTSLVLGQAQSSGAVCQRRTRFLKQIVNDRLLVPFGSAGE
jgi:hypothetical protein